MREIAELLNAETYRSEIHKAELVREQLVIEYEYAKSKSAVPRRMAGHPMPLASVPSSPSLRVGSAPPPRPSNVNGIVMHRVQFDYHQTAAGRRAHPQHRGQKGRDARQGSEPYFMASDSAAAGERASGECWRDTRTR